MIKKMYYCKACDFTFERVLIEGVKREKCPLCGTEDIELKEEKEKTPLSCNSSSKFT